MNRTFLMIRSVGFALFTKLSGAATVFIALPLVAHQTSPADYAVFLTTMNAVATMGLVSLPYSVLFVRELAHAFAADDPQTLRASVRETFGAHIALATLVAAIVAVVCIVAYTGWRLSPAFAIGAALSSVQIAASYGQLYRIAERTDHVTSLAQTASNIVMVGLLVLLAQIDRLNDVTVCLAYFGVPTLVEALIFAQAARSRRLPLAFGADAFLALRARIRESLPLYLSPIADYLKVYASAMLVLAAANSYDYIMVSTSILLIARVVNPLTLITRPLMPAFIDALQRGDRAWLGGLKKALFAAAAAGAALAGALPFVISKELLAFVFPPEIRDGLTTPYVAFCSFFAYSYALTALLAPLYVGARRASFYGVANFAFTFAAAALGTLATTRYGAAGMMGALAVLTTLCGLYLLLSMSWPAKPAPAADGKAAA